MLLTYAGYYVSQFLLETGPWQYAINKGELVCSEFTVSKIHFTFLQYDDTLMKRLQIEKDIKCF